MSDITYGTDLNWLVAIIAMALLILALIVYWHSKIARIGLPIMTIIVLCFMGMLFISNKNAVKHMTTHTATYQISSIDHYDDGYSVNTTKKIAFPFDGYDSTGYKAGDIIKITYKKSQPNHFGEVVYSFVKVEKVKSTGTYAPVKQTDEVIWEKFRKPFD
mgnify:CR=1 FL=1